MYLTERKYNLTRVEDWYEAIIEDKNYLEKIFNDTLYGNNIFTNIYISIRDNPRTPQEELEPNYLYINVGFPVSQIADYFNTRYSANCFLYTYRLDKDYQKLLSRIKSIYNANFYKYKKLIEVMGYRYNPLFNVDATELYSNMEAIGDSKTTRTPEGSIISTSGTLNAETEKIEKTTTTNYVNPYDQNSASANIIDNKSEQTPITSEQSYNEYSETTEYENQPAQSWTYNSSTGTITKDGIFSLAAKDSAFGVSLGGAERYYAEKRIRQGNIGVTKSTELLESQREVVRFNILDEFFRDLEKDIIVGIY